MSVRPKKHLGQHFLKDDAIAEKIVSFLSPKSKSILEIGPGKGILSKYLFNKYEDVKLVEIDNEAVHHLLQIFPKREKDILQKDFLEMNLQNVFPGNFSIIGNFPYNISSQILFCTLDNKDRIDEVLGMFQKEVAQRIVSPPGNRDYGILSVFVQAFYDVEIVLTLNEEDFSPPPKVKSAVIHLRRNHQNKLKSNEKIFFRVVKTGFNQRRKKLSNALSSLIPKNKIQDFPFLDLRAEALSWKQFDELAVQIENIQPTV